MNELEPLVDQEKEEVDDSVWEELQAFWRDEGIQEAVRRQRANTMEFYLSDNAE